MSFMWVPIGLPVDKHELCQLRMNRGIARLSTDLAEIIRWPVVSGAGPVDLSCGSATTHTNAQ